MANDLLAFQLDRDRRNFLFAVEEELGAEIESEGTRVRFEGRSTTVVTVPIGVDYDRIQAIASDASLAIEQQRLIDLFQLDAEILGIGVDRLARFCSNAASHRRNLSPSVNRSLCS